MRALTSVQVTPASHPWLFLAVRWCGRACGHYFPAGVDQSFTLVGATPARVARLEAAFAVVAGGSWRRLARGMSFSGVVVAPSALSPYLERLVEAVLSYAFDGSGYGGAMASGWVVPLTQRAFVAS